MKTKRKKIEAEKKIQLNNCSCCGLEYSPMIDNCDCIFLTPSTAIKANRRIHKAFWTPRFKAPPNIALKS
uniref:Ribosome biogenesis protein n=1 Tax=Romanomermis culicivorax TaxID=13658 RepID=A0A915L456_ROMCU